MTNSEPDEAATHRELATLRSQVDEASALEQYLRERTIILNNEIRRRDRAIAERDLAIRGLLRHLANLRSPRRRRGRDQNTDEVGTEQRTATS